MMIALSNNFDSKTLKIPYLKFDDAQNQQQDQGDERRDEEGATATQPVGEEDEHLPGPLPVIAPSTRLAVGPEAQLDLGDQGSVEVVGALDYLEDLGVAEVAADRVLL